MVDPSAMGFGELVEEVEALRVASADLLKAYDMIFPGVKHIAVQDYALVNEAPLNMRNLLK